jgi:hypothetical protein
MEKVRLAMNNLSFGSGSFGFGSFGFGRNFGPFEQPHGLHHHIHHRDDASGNSTGTTSTTTPTATPASGNVSSINALDALSSILSGFSSAVANLNDRLGTLTGNSDTQSTDGVLSTSGVGAQLITKERGVLQIQTQEGDIVTLKFNAKTAVNYQAYSASDGTNSVSGEALDIRSRARVHLSVEGNLNDDELAAVNDLVGKVGTLTDDFYNGNVDQAVNEVFNLSYDNSQLASVSLNLSLKQSLAVQGYSYVAALPTPTSSEPSTATPTTNTPAAAPTTTESAAASQTVAGVTTPVASSDTASATDSAKPVVEMPVATSQADAAATETAPAATSAAPADTAQPVASPTQSLAAFMLKVRESFKVTTTDATLGFSYEFKVRLLMTSIQNNAPASNTPSDPVLGTLNNQLSASAAA